MNHHAQLLIVDSRHFSKYCSLTAQSGLENHRQVCLSLEWLGMSALKNVGFIVVALDGSDQG